MIGWRGASRYYSPNYKAAFGLECRAMKKIREDMGLTNVEIMIPFPRTVEEAKKVIETMAEFGLRQGENGLKVIGMCEIPSNVIMAEEFLEVFDGFSIGTNDLTQYTCALDRQNAKLEPFFNPHHPAVLRAIKMTIEAGHRHGIWVGICGELGADTALTETFLRMGVDELSMNAKSILPVRKIIRSVDLSKPSEK